MTRAVHVCVVMPVHDRRELTLRCLDSIAAATRSTDALELAVSVVVVDDGSTDGTADAIARRHPDVRVVRADGSLYYAAGTHAGQRVALDIGADVVVSMNDDTVLTTDALVALVTALERHRRTIVGALLVPIDDPDLVMLVAPQWTVAYGGWRHAWSWRRSELPSDDFRVDSIVGNCVAMRSDDLRAVGLISSAPADHFVADVAWTNRFARAGYGLVIAPAAVVMCEPSTAPASLRSLGRRGALRALFVDRRHPANLWVAWRNRWETAPSRAQAVAAFTVHLGRLLQRAIGAGTWPHWPDHPPPLPS